jgi:hypothetical protein
MFDTIGLHNELLKITHLTGMISNDKMKISELDSFFEENRKTYEPVITEYVKKLTTI